MRLRTRVKNRIHALLEKQGVVPLPVSDLFGRKGLEWLRGLPFSELYRRIRNRYLSILETLSLQVKESEKTIDETVALSPEAQLLMTVPGIGRYLALLVLAESGEIERFPNPKHLVSYAGLCPSTYASGGMSRHGRITKQGSAWLRWAFVEAATHVGQYPHSRLAKFFHRLRHRRDVKTARVAVARELCVVIFHILKKEQPYRETE